MTASLALEIRKLRQPWVSMSEPSTIDLELPFEGLVFISLLATSPFVSLMSIIDVNMIKKLSIVYADIKNRLYTLVLKYLKHSSVVSPIGFSDWHDQRRMSLHLQYSSLPIHLATFLQYE